MSSSAWAQTDVTSTYLTNAGFDDNTSWQTSNVAAGASANSKEVAGWTSNGGAGWSSSAAFGFGGTGQINGVAVPTNNSNDAPEGGALGISTGWGGTIQYTQTVTLPAGAYKFSYSAINMLSGKTQNTSKCGYKIGSGNYTYTTRNSWPYNEWIADELNFNLTEESEVTFAIGLTAISGGSGDNSKVLFDYVKLLQVPYATAQDIDALNDAISDADSYTIGFANGEYAPYTNVAALSALKSAKEVSATAESENVDKLTVTNATTALENAIWTVNTAEMNAIFNGDFSAETPYNSSRGAYEPTGWNNWGDNVYNTRIFKEANMGANTGIKATSATATLFAKFTTAYGTTEGYTMPLKAGAYYLNFIYGGWGETGTRDINVYLKDDNNTKGTVSTTKVTAKNGSANSSEEAWSTYNGIITIPSDGEYVLEFYRQSTNAQNQIVISDIEIIRVPVTEIAGTTVSAANGWGTFISEINRDIPTGMKAYSCAAVADQTLTLDEATSIKANTPYILENTTAEDITIAAENGQSLKVANSYTIGLLTGVYTSTPAIKDTYVLQNNAEGVGFYKVETAGITTVGANRAYLTAPAASARVRAFNLGNNANAIEAISAIANNAIEAIYNANGVKVNALQKGINVVKMQNGKTQKVLVK